MAEPTNAGRSTARARHVEFAPDLGRLMRRGCTRSALAACTALREALEPHIAGLPPVEADAWMLAVIDFVTTTILTAESASERVSAAACRAVLLLDEPDQERLALAYADARRNGGGSYSDPNRELRPTDQPVRFSLGMQALGTTTKRGEVAATGSNFRNRYLDSMTRHLSEQVASKISLARLPREIEPLLARAANVIALYEDAEAQSRDRGSTVHVAARSAGETPDDRTAEASRPSSASVPETADTGELEDQSLPPAGAAPSRDRFRRWTILAGVSVVVLVVAGIVLGVTRPWEPSLADQVVVTTAPYQNGDGTHSLPLQDATYWLPASTDLEALSALAGTDSGTGAGYYCSPAQGEYLATVQGATQLFPHRVTFLNNSNQALVLRNIVATANSGEAPHEPGFYFHCPTGGEPTVWSDATLNLDEGGPALYVDSADPYSYNLPAHEETGIRFTFTGTRDFAGKVTADVVGGETGQVVIPFDFNGSGPDVVWHGVAADKTLYVRNDQAASGGYACAKTVDDLHSVDVACSIPTIYGQLAVMWDDPQIAVDASQRHWKATSCQTPDADASWIDGVAHYGLETGQLSVDGPMMAKTVDALRTACGDTYANRVLAATTFRTAALVGDSTKPPAWVMCADGTEPAAGGRWEGGSITLCGGGTTATVSDRELGQIAGTDCGGAGAGDDVQCSAADYDIYIYRSSNTVSIESRGDQSDAARAVVEWWQAPHVGE